MAAEEDGQDMEKDKQYEGSTIPNLYAELIQYLLHAYRQ
jgi:hypothetical protein